MAMTKIKIMGFSGLPKRIMVDIDGIGIKALDVVTFGALARETVFKVDSERVKKLLKVK